MALEDAFKQIDSQENVNKILKDEIVFLKSELEQNVNFNEERDNNIDYLEAQRREKDLERKHSIEISEKDRYIAKLQREVESYRKEVLEYERKHSETLKKIVHYEENINQLNRRNEKTE